MRRLKWILIILFILIGSGPVQAQDRINWTENLDQGIHYYYGVAYGNGSYVVVGIDGIIRTSPDLLAWHTQQVGEELLYDVIYDGRQFVAVGKAGMVLTSPNGYTWAKQATGINDQDLYLTDLVWSGSEFIIVGTKGTIITSTDSRSWKKVNSGTQEQLTGVAWNGKTYVVVGAQGIIQTSVDGERWQTVRNEITNPLLSVTWDGTQFIACGTPGIILTSPDGSIWEQQFTASNLGFTSICWRPGEVLAISDDGGAILSSDGIRWSTSLIDSQVRISDVIWDGTQYIAVGNAILVSADGRNWLEKLARQVDNVSGLALGPEKVIAVGYNGTIRISSDLVNWRNVQVPGDNFFTGAAWGEGKYVVVGNYKILTSPDGERWVETITDFCLNDVTYNGSEFLVVGENGVVIKSQDGQNWEEYLSRTNQSLQGVCWGNGQYIAVGSAGTIQTSADGASWMPRSSGFDKVLYDVIWTGESYFITGMNGAILASPDGVNWTVNNCGVNEHVFALAKGDNCLVALVGYNGMILTSQDGLKWNKSKSKWGWSWGEIEYYRSTFLIAGSTILTGVIEKPQIVLKIGNPYMITREGLSLVDSGGRTVPLIDQGRTLLPIRALVEYAGGTVNYEAMTRKVTIGVKGNSIEMWLDKKRTYVNGVADELDLPPKVINGRTMIPLRYVMNNLGWDVIWDETTQEISLFMQ